MAAMGRSISINEEEWRVVTVGDRTVRLVSTLSRRETKLPRDFFPCPVGRGDLLRFSAVLRRRAGGSAPVGWRETLESLRVPTFSMA